MSVSDNIFFKGMSIHKISYSEKKNPPPVDPSTFIQNIVDTYNNNNESQNKPASEDRMYKPIAIPKYKSEDHRGFEIKPYYSRRERSTDFGRYLESIGGQAPISGNFSTYADLHFLYFLYRAVFQTKQTVSVSGMSQTEKKTTRVWEIFAITSNDAWQVIVKFRDYSFPIKIAKKVVDPELSTSDSKHIAGLKNSSSETYREGISAQRNEIQSTWQIFKTFSSHFKLGSSMYSLEVFNPMMNRKISVQIKDGSILINHEMGMAAYEEIVEHFGKIDRGEKTFIEVDGRPQEEKDDPAFRYLEYIQRVRGEVLEKLNIRWMEIIWIHFQSGASSQSITFVHRYYRDFYGSSLFELKHQDGIHYEWHHRPSFLEVCKALKEILPPVKSAEEFSKELDKVKIKYDKKAGFHPIKEFFQGEVKFEKEMYFRNDGAWFQSRVEHLALLQRSFFDLLSTHLLRPNESGYLQKPWIAKEEWASFSLQDVLSKTQLSEEQANAAIKTLSETFFSFIDKQGAVKNFLISSAVFRDKLLKKNKEAIEGLLEACHSAHTPLKIDELHKLFKQRATPESSQSIPESPSTESMQNESTQADPASEENSSRPSTPESQTSTQKGSQKSKTPKLSPAQEVYELLQQERAICKSARAGTFSRIRVLDEAGYVLYPEIGRIDFKVDFLNKRRAELENALMKKFEAKQIFSKEDLKGLVAARFLDSAYKKLQDPRLPPSPGLEKDRYLIQGPIPQNVVMEKPLRDFFNNAYTNYVSIAEEEGYNRSFFADLNYLVCDQVYSSKREKVELFDVLYHGNKDNLFLYHIKEGFGQTTRDACSQVRNAAIMLRNAIDNGSYQILRNLYANATTSGDKTPFREKVKKKLEALQEEGFINLFKNKDRKHIVFVYAFLDDATSERLLERETSPDRVFTDSDFASLGIDHFLIELKTKKFLDEHNQISDTFLRSTEEFFKNEMKHLNTSHSALQKAYSILYSHVSQYDSVIAKIELLQIRREIVEEMGFGFKICQIRRTPGLFTKIEAHPETFDYSEIQHDSTYDSDDMETFIMPRRQRPSQVATPNPATNATPYPGIINKTGNDCFLNSAFQLMIRTPLWNFLLNEANLANPANGQQLFDGLTNFNAFYQDTLSKTNLTTDQFRALLGFSATAQEDAAQALELIAENYTLDPISSFFKNAKTLDLDHKIILPNENPTHYSQYSQDTTFKGQVEPYFLLKIDLTAQADDSGKVPFQDLLDLFLKPPHLDSEPIKFVYNGKVYQAPVTAEWLEPQKLANDLFLQVKRFKQENGDQVKLNIHLEIGSGSYTFTDKIYELTGFIVHYGKTTRGGHYMCFEKIEEKWFCFNDGDVTELPQEKLAEEFAKAYIVRLTAVGLDLD